MPNLIALALFLTPTFLAQEGEPRVELPSRITEVTVYGGSASVRRSAQLPAGDGTFVLAGLPITMDPDSLRVRTGGAEVVSVETKERLRKSAPDPRLAEVQARLRGMEQSYFAVVDELEVARTLADHVERMLRTEEDAHVAQVREGRADPSAWEANYAWLSAKLALLKTTVRAKGQEEEALRLALQDLRLELGRLAGDGAGVRLRDVIVDVVDTDGAPGSLELEYVVGNAGWTPTYDLRAAKTLDAVELVYRAKVWQRSGEDWREAAIVLSTARPELGTKGPELQPVWLSLDDPARDRYSADARSRGPGGPPAEESDGFFLGKGMLAGADEPERMVPFAEVQAEGLSVRYRLPRAETIESRDEPTTVLVGRARLSVTPDRICAPSLDEHVWLRAVATNTSPWVMLPGVASVYFGADYIGRTPVDSVQTGAELTLHLGPDPGLSTKRTRLEDLHEGAGIFSSRATQRDAWRIEVTNAGGLSSRADGAVEVIVQEVLPRTKDDRIVVKLAEVKPKPSGAERWAKVREEEGLLTWVVNVARGGTTTIEVATEIAFPEKSKVLRR